MATSKVVDFSNVKDGGNFNKNRIPAGDYKAKILKVDDAEAKDKTPQYLFSLQIVGRSSSVFPYYCKLQENQLWKLRNILIAAGKSVPKSKIRVDVNQIVGKFIGVTVDDTEYDGKDQSEITGVFPAADLDDDASAAGDDDDEATDEGEDEDLDLDSDDVSEEAEEEEAEEEPEPEAEEEGDEFDALDRLELRKALIKFDIKTSKSQTDDDLRDLLRQKTAEAAKPKAKPAAKPAAKKPAAKPKAAEVSDDDLDELDIDEL